MRLGSPVRHAHGTSRPIRVRQAHPPLLLLALCLATAVSTLLSAVWVATQAPGARALGTLAGASLDYGRGPLGQFFPLTEKFVRQTLGAPSRGGAGSPLGGDPGLAAGSGAAALAAGSSGLDRATVVPLSELDVTRGDLGNDDFASAYTVRGLPFTARSRGGSREEGEPTSCARSGTTRWFRYVPRTDLELTAGTAGSDLGTALAVFTGSSLQDLRPVACSNEASGTARLTVPSRAGTAYWFQATKTLTDGVLVFSLAVRGRTALVSVTDDGRDPAGESVEPKISADGRYVVFDSRADLVPGTQGTCVAPPRPDPTAGSTVVFTPRPGPCKNVYRRDLLTGTTELVSTRDGTAGGDDDSGRSALSADGRFVSFHSYATNLLEPGEDTNGTQDIFLRDMLLKQTRRVSLTSEGQQTSDPFPPALPTAVSADGRFVAFSSNARELDPEPEERSDCRDACLLAYVRDMLRGTTHVVSKDEDGELYRDSIVAGLSADGRRVYLGISASGRLGFPQAVVVDWRTPGASQVVGINDEGDPPQGGAFTLRMTQGMSGDGRYVVFWSDAANVVAGDLNGETDFFVRDLLLGQTTRVSVASDGGEGEAPAQPENERLSALGPGGRPNAGLSADGRYVTFASDMSRLVPDDTNGTFDVFVHDRFRRTTVRASVLGGGGQSAGASYSPSVAIGGNRVVFNAQGFEPGSDNVTLSVYLREQPSG
jgi:Tol biopolymer transport system component